MNVLPLTTIILLIGFNHVTTVNTQGMPISPCPKIFQYHFDGTEWLGMIAIRNVDNLQALHLRVTLSMRGKPTTSYLGEIELLNRGQFIIGNLPSNVNYRIKFPKHHLAPKLLHISVNNHVICLGSADHSIFMTQIQLEHIKKFPTSSSTTTSNNQHPHHHLPPPSTQFKKKAFDLSKDICGKSAINLQLPQILQEQQQQQQYDSDSDSDAIHRSNHHNNDDNGDGDDSHTHLSPIFANLSDYNDDFDDKDDEPMMMMENDEKLTTATTTSAINNNNNNNNSKKMKTNLLSVVTRGTWPWMAAIYVNNFTSLDYQCGGTLISNRAVISSAHCFQLLNQHYTANEVLVFLGRYNLKNWNEDGSLAAPVDAIYIHTDYNSQLNSYDADIAVIMLKNQIRFNTYIRPVCLWSGPSKMENIIGELGVVIGWSWSFNRIPSNANRTAHHSTNGMGSLPKILHVPIISNEDCFKTNSHYQSLSSNRTFCAGIINGGGVNSNCGNGENGFCNGISGAGLMLYKNNRWMLRGTVSSALPPSSTSSSSSNNASSQYIIYTDVAKFIDWLTAFVI